VSRAAPRLSALIVNYRSGAFTLACARSLRAAWEGAGRAPESLEVVVADNQPHELDQAPLRELEAEGARILRLPRNAGYSGGANQALETSSGGPDDLVCVLNPDLFFAGNSLEPLIECLDAHPACGAAAPAGFLDPSFALHLPPQSLPSPRQLLAAQRAIACPRRAALHAARRARLALSVWTARSPLPSEMLSGACMLLRRSVVARLGGLFDEGYPLYFEDADLCRRIARHGLALLHVPRSRIVHHWARSSGAGEETLAPVEALWRTSRDRYLERHHGDRALARVRQGEAKLEDIPAERRFRPFHDFTDLGLLDAAPELSWWREAPFVVEIGMGPLFLLAAGALGTGARWRCPATAWEWFFAGTYHARALTRNGGELLGAWTFRKESRARTRPLEIGELGAVGSDSAQT
jgi:GT2 family glycosyltransferase